MTTVHCDGCGNELTAATRNRVKVANVYSKPQRLDYCESCARDRFPSRIYPMLSWTATLPPGAPRPPRA